MRALPTEFSVDDLIAHLASHYVLAVESLEFVPKGDIGWSWVVHRGADADPLFVKVYDGAAHGGGHMEKVRRGLRLLEIVRHERLLDNVAAPIGSPETGELDTALGGDERWRVAVQSYLPGDSQGGRELTPAAGVHVGRTAGRLHNATDVLVSPLGLDVGAGGHAAWSVEAFLREREDALKAVAPDELVKDWGRVDDALARVRALEAEEAAAAAAGPVVGVVVHGDMVADNVIVDSSGGSGVDGVRVSIVDWDDVRLAPAEIELSLLAWLAVPAFPAIADAYRAEREAGGADWQPLNAARLELQTWRYNMGSIGFYVDRLQNPDLPEEQVESDRGLLGWCMQEWSVLPDKFAAASKTSLFQP